MPAKPFDYASNLANPAMAAAVAAASRDAKGTGTAYRVEWHGRCWAGSRYDAIGLARDLYANGYDVTLTAPDGRAVDIKSARY